MDPITQEECYVSDSPEEICDTEYQVDTAEDEEDHFQYSDDEPLHNEELINEAKLDNQTPCAQVGPDSQADHDSDSDDSGIDERSSLEIVSTQTTVQLPRGRYTHKFVNEEGQSPCPRVYDVLQPDAYPSPARVARLPASYYRKRGEGIQRVVPQLIHFQATFDAISFIIDRNSSGDKGYQHAWRRLKEIQSDLDTNPLEPIQEIWCFGLEARHLKLPKQITCNLTELFPQKIDNEECLPYWVLFKTLPKFQSELLRQEYLKDSEITKHDFILDDNCYCDLSYGAITSMNHFHIYHDSIVRKSRRWCFRFQHESFQIYFYARQPSLNTQQCLTQMTYKIPIDIIDRAVIFDLKNDGFDLYVHMKGNVHELRREVNLQRDNNDKTFTPSRRQGMPNGKPMPLFSTLRIRVHIKADDSLNDNIQRKQNTETSESNNSIEYIRNKTLEQIQQAFKCYIEYFHKNRIRICFGPIRTRKTSLEQLCSLGNHRFPTFIQSYSWAMLRNMNFRVQIHLVRAKEFFKNLESYLSKLVNKSTNDEVDDRFYRLCLYLRRRASEYYFLDLDQEILIAIRSFTKKYKQFQVKDTGLRSNNRSSSPSVDYIPSVVVTPTTILILPLKICKLNRVLRERNFGSVLNFALLELRDEAQRLLFSSEFRSLKDQILNFLVDGFELVPGRTYKYLHHSQSQVKCKQFWFYYHDQKNGCLSHDDAYTWMGNFDKERVVAKHSARIALCFTSTDATIPICAETVTYVRDIKDPTGKYVFSDGVGTISTNIRDRIKSSIKHNYDFSVLQIRYGGCKGTLSVDPRLDNQRYQMRIRDSMQKFISDHDILELCKLSAPRALYLNRQDIVLLESRDISHTTFLRLQNEDHLWLIECLLKKLAAYELLRDKLLPVFSLRNTVRNLDLANEPFFMQLIVTCAFNIIRELVDRTRIRISKEKARNMFGIVDEYAVLEYGQVFIQYSPMRRITLDDSDADRNLSTEPCTILTGKVVITKNPCHHPGDLRVFDAVDRPQLRHLKDVVVFPQKGHRPHANEISGSDLDGDEYVVIWHEDLIPSTENEQPYEYDAQGEAKKMDRPITRTDINKVVMEVSEQDCLGTLSNLHLAFVDQYGIKSEKCKTLAGYISEEVDAAKTGKHPLTDDEIHALREELGDKWPDFMKGRGKKKYYPSKCILGKLYRSARRMTSGWSRAVMNYGSSLHLELVTSLIHETTANDKEHTQNIQKNMLSNQQLDPSIYHKDWRVHLDDIKELYSYYQSELLEIISVYRFQNEIDLFCRCESMDSSAGGKNKRSLEDSAATEVEALINRVRTRFYFEFRAEKGKSCGCTVEDLNTNRKRTVYCSTCQEKKAFSLKTSRAKNDQHKILYKPYKSQQIRTRSPDGPGDFRWNDPLAKAACAYIYTYERNIRLPLASNRRIFSFPWLFAESLITLRTRNNTQSAINPVHDIVANACSSYLTNFKPSFKVSVLEESLNETFVEFYYKKIENQPTDSLLLTRRKDEKILNISLLSACFIEILNDWLIKQNIFGNTCDELSAVTLVPESIWHELMVEFLLHEYHKNVRLVLTSATQPYITERYSQAIEQYRSTWNSREDEQLLNMFTEMHRIAAKHSRDDSSSTMWCYLDEYILLALQCIAIEKTLVEKWIRS